jgi:hypothetical protein
MNLPENASETAKKVYQILEEKKAPLSKADVLLATAPALATDEMYKAISTADSLVVKGIITENAGEGGSKTYTLQKDESQVGPLEEADAKEEYAKKTDVNEEEKRMIQLFEQWGKTLPDTTLYSLYEREQLPVDVSTEELEKALQELVDAGAITQNGATYQLA